MTAITGLVDVQASLALFAEAIIGAPVPFVVAETKGECWPWAPRDPSGQVTVPVELGSREMYRATVLHQLLVRPVADSGLPPDVELQQLFDMIEDHRVRAFTQRRFPGAMPGLDQLLAEFAARREHDKSGPQAAMLLSQMRRYCLGSDRETSLAGLSPDDGLTLDHAIGIADRVVVEGATSSDSARASLEIWQLINNERNDDSLADLIAQLAPEDDMSDALATEATTGVSLESGTPTEFVDSDGQAGGQLLGDIDDETVTMSVDGETEPPAAGIELLAKRRASPASRNRTFVYDEWDYRANAHRPAWCRVTEEQLVGDDLTFLDEVRSRYQTLRSQIRRSLLKMPPQELVRVPRSNDGDELDIDAAIEAMADRRSGAPVDDRLQIRRDRAARDVATAFLVDLSASTSSPAVPPEPEPMPPDADPFDDPLSYGPIWGAPPETEPVRRVIDVAKDAVALMGDALHELGDRYAIYGFSGTGREGVEFKIGKDFNDRVTPAGWAAVGEMKPLRYTRMGPAVRHAAVKLAAESARTKLLIVISDGYPQDTDYGYDRNDRDYGLHDTARALADAAGAGIESFCVTIDPAGHDYLRQMCPDDRYLVIGDVESLPEELARLYFLTLRR